MKNIQNDIENYSNWLKDKPALATFLLRAQSHALSGDHKSAVLDVKAALELDPNHAHGHHTMSILMVHRGEYASALKFAKKAHILDRGTDDLAYMVAFEGDRLTKKIAAAPTAALYHKRGLLALHQGAYLPAKADFEAAIRIDPGLESAYTHLANTFIKLGQPFEAEKVLDEISDRNPSFQSDLLLKVKQWCHLERKLKHSPSHHTYQQLLKFNNAEQSIHTLNRAEELAELAAKS